MNGIRRIDNSIMGDHGNMENLVMPLTSDHDL